VGGVDIAEDIGFECGVDGDESESSDDFGVVGDFLWSEEDFAFESVEVVVDVIEDVGADGEGASAGESDAVVIHKLNDGVLYDFGVDIDGRDANVFAHAA